MDCSIGHSRSEPTLTDQQFPLVLHQARYSDTFSSPAEDNSWMGSPASTSFQLGRQAMAFTHGNSTFNGNNISIVDNPVHNGIVNRAMRRLVKRLLKKHKYPPEGMEDVVQTVMS